MILAHKIQLDPTFKQQAYFTQAAGTDRFTWNWALAEWNKAYEQGERPTANGLKKRFNSLKYNQYPWLSGIHRDAHADAFSRLGKAFAQFFKRKAGRPKFHKKGRKDSFYVANDRMQVSGRMIRLPVIGWVRMTESLRFTGKIQSACVSKTAGKWFVSITVDVINCTRDRVASHSVGVDLGITTLATLSTGEKIPGPRPLIAGLRRLRRLSQRVSRKQKGSSNRRKAVAKLTKAHYRVANIRKDFTHKLTTRLCSENQAVAIEGLAVSNMVKNRSLAKHVSDAGWAEIRRQLEYKSKIYGSKLAVVDRWFPSSKTCRKCQAIKRSLTLKDRVFRCDSCGHTEDRDVNAARNLLTAGFAGIYAWGEEGSGNGPSAVAKPTSLNQELNRAY